MSKFILMIMIGCSLVAGDVYFYKYNKDGTPYSKTKEGTGEIYFYTNRYIEVNSMEVTTKLVADVNQSSNIGDLHEKSLTFCSAWKDIASKDKTCREFADKIVEKSLYPSKILNINIHNIKVTDYRWINQTKYLETLE